MKAFDPQHPFPCVYFKHGAYWHVKRGKWARIGATFTEAADWYDKNVLAAGKTGKLPRLIESTLDHHAKVQRLADSTRSQYEAARDVLKRKFAQFDSPAQVKPRHVAQLKVDGAATPNMTNRVVSLLRTLFGYWLEQGLCDTNPCIGVRRFKEPKRTRLITAAEWAAIYDKAGPRLKAIMKVAVLTGQRIGDVLAIRRSQLGEEGIAFRQQKTDKPLVVRWTPDLRAAVAEALATHPSGREGLTLFMSNAGGAPDYRSVHEQWTRACKAANVVDARPNDQRAQALTEAKRQGKNPTALAGHASQAMTDRYLRDRSGELVDGPDLRQALDVGQKSV